MDNGTYPDHQLADGNREPRHLHRLEPERYSKLGQTFIVSKTFYTHRFIVEGLMFEGLECLNQDVSDTRPNPPGWLSYENSERRVASAGHGCDSI
jgi:hypothetical protein